jgi:V8-like Glu-specific endopeptidase
VHNVGLAGPHPGHVAHEDSRQRGTRMNNNAGSNRLWVRMAALALAALLLVGASPTPTAAPSPKDAPPRYEVEPLPRGGPPRDVPGSVNQLIAYRAGSGAVELFPLPAVDGAPGAAFVPGRFDFVDAPALPQDFGGLSAVSDPAAWPWRGHVKLFRTFPSGIVSDCSGVLVDSMHVLTAGHCVWTFVSSRCNAPDTACWASSMRIMPAYDKGSTPYGEANFATLYAWTAWTVNENHDWDIALIELDRPLGALTNWYGYGYNNDGSFFTGGNTFRSTGYPAESPYDGEEMYTWAGTFDEVETYGLIHTDYSFGGQSGSGVYRDDSNRIVYGALSHGHDAIPNTVYTRITAASFTTFGDWIAGDTPNTVDLIPLDANVSPAVFDRGDPLTALNYLIHNYSEAGWNGAVSLGVYLSTNHTISTGDRQISTRSWSGSLAAKGSIRINAGAPLPAIPGDICGAWPGGSDYWIGIILNVADANAANNDTSGWDAAPIHVNACDQYEVDDTWSQASWLNPGQTQTHDIIPAYDEDWASFTLSGLRGVRLETAGSSGDTRMWLYDSGLDQLDYDDDDGAGAFSRIDACLPAGTYYVKIDEYNQDHRIYGYTLSLTTGVRPVGTCQEIFLPQVWRDDNQ